MGESQQKRLTDLFNRAKDRDDIYKGDLDNIDFYNLFIRAGLIDTLQIWKDINVCAYKYKYLSKDAILMILSIPIVSEKESCKSKPMAERIMNIVKDSETCFTTIDFNTSIEIKKEKFVYITLVKIIEEEEL